MSIDTKQMQKWFALKKNPNLAVLDFLENADSFTKSLAKKAIEEITQQLTDEFNEKISGMIKQLENSIPEISEQITEQIKNYTLSKPELFKGEDGKEYVLTEKDKKQISESIKVPVVKQIVEKREIIREQPIEKITNEIKEVAKYEEPKQLAKKLNTLEEVIEQKVIKGLEEKFDQFKNAIKNVSVNVSASKGGGGMGNIITETPSGTVNGVNDTFTLTSNVKSNSLILLWNGQFQRAGASFEYTLSGKTITFNAGSVPTAGELFAWYIRI